MRQCLPAGSEGRWSACQTWGRCPRCPTHRARSRPSAGASEAQKQQNCGCKHTFLLKERSIESGTSRQRATASENAARRSETPDRVPCALTTPNNSASANPRAASSSTGREVATTACEPRATNACARPNVPVAPRRAGAACVEHHEAGNTRAASTSATVSDPSASASLDSQPSPACCVTRVVQQIARGQGSRETLPRGHVAGQRVTSHPCARNSCSTQLPSARAPRSEPSGSDTTTARPGPSSTPRRTDVEPVLDRHLHDQRHAADHGCVQRLMAHLTVGKQAHPLGAHEHVLEGASAWLPEGASAPGYR